MYHVHTILTAGFYMKLFWPVAMWFYFFSCCESVHLMKLGTGQNVLYVLADHGSLALSHVPCAWFLLLPWLYVWSSHYPHVLVISGHLFQVTAPLQTDNHASTSPLIFYTPDALPAAQPTASKHWRQTQSVKNLPGLVFQTTLTVTEQM